MADRSDAALFYLSRVRASARALFFSLSPSHTYMHTHTCKYTRNVRKIMTIVPK